MLSWRSKNLLFPDFRQNLANEDPFDPVHSDMDSKEGARSSPDTRDEQFSLSLYQHCLKVGKCQGP